ncbi:MAG: DNA-binding protein [Nitrosopumilaceae archaeon]|nr:DNA-binding protein [Nitrosopumilaceae archaeon]
MASIKEVKNQRNNIDVEGTIKEISEPRTVTTRYGESQVCDAYLVDAEGDRIKLSLWGDDIKKVKNDDKISIKGGYTNTFRNELQLNIPKKSGELKVVG